jgi:hypothetical protein
LIAILGVLLIPALIAHYNCHEAANRFLGHAMGAVTTVFMIGSIALLVQSLPKHGEAPVVLLKSAAALWFTNVLVFASWYWRLDAGGPHARDRRGQHIDGAFLFPQMALHPDIREETGKGGWSPGFIDYLFLAFNTSTALSPADTAVLSRWAKLLMMVQSGISLTVIVLLAARAVNIL